MPPLPQAPPWFEPKITLGTIVTTLSVLLGGVWAAGRIVSSLETHLSRVETIEQAHYAELKQLNIDIANSVEQKLAETDKRRAELQSQERQDIETIRRILEDNLRRRGGDLPVFEGWKPG